ncbi:MAG: type II secretion system F family protein [Candidatus Gracilibacteria bacterium]|nr:type II secretion system F family protein [Candidatus Gracilibacteria bacterium]
MFGNSFYDKYGNFNNQKFVAILEKARKAKRNKQMHKSGKINFEITLFESVSKKDVWGFINKFSIFVNSGIDVKGALGILVKQVKNPYLKRIVSEMKENINHGISISETMNEYPKVFDSLTTALVGVGEKTGQLGKILIELDQNLLENIELKGKVKGAMIYPMILLGLTITMVIFMMIFIVPRITAAFEKSGTALPALTQFIVGVSNFFMNDYLKLILGVIGLVLVIRMINSTYVGKMGFAKMFTKMPIFGYVVKQSNIVFFIKSFTILLDSGVLLLESLKTSSKVVPNLAYKKELIRIKNEVEVGLTISKSLGLNLDYESSVYLNPLFPEEFAYVVSTGEETGSLSDSLKKVGNNYNGELKRYIGNMSSMMEPIIIVIVGALVGTIIVGVMLPFFEMGKIAKNL